MGIAGVYLAANLVADAASAYGVDAARPARGDSEVYLAVRVGPQALDDPGLGRVLAADGVTAVVDGRTAAADPAGVARLARDGVDIASGGWATGGWLHVVQPSDQLLRATRAVRLATGVPCREFAPASPVNSVDLASAIVRHVRIIRASEAREPSEDALWPARLQRGVVYIVRSQADSAVGIEHNLNLLIAPAERSGLSVDPLSGMG